MTKRIGALALVFLFLLSPCAGAFAADLGPANTYEQLLSLAASASVGDVLLIQGAIEADAAQPLAPEAALYVRSASGGASISGLRVLGAQLTFSDLELAGGLTAEGESHIQLTRGVTVSGGLSFTGSGSLLLDPGSRVTGAAGAPGISICHTGGDLYISLDGTVLGGDGATGGAAAVIDPLGASGALMVTGSLTGGRGDAFGGNALNLHNLSGNAYITVDGRLVGGEGDIGGTGLQLITASGTVAAGLGGLITGGRGNGYGGDAMLLMNIGGSASVALSGALTGGDSSGTDSTPGQSLKLLGQTTAMRTSVLNCILQDGRQVLYALSVTPLPAITSSIDDAATIEPTPIPPPAATIEPTIEPTAEPTAQPTPPPTDTPSPLPTPTAQPTAEPAPEPTSVPTAAPTAEPTPPADGEATFAPEEAPTPVPTQEPGGDPTFAPEDDPTPVPTQEPGGDPTFAPTMEPIATGAEAQ